MARPVPGRGDDLGVLPGHIRDETVDLVYLREGLACCHGRHCFGRCWRHQAPIVSPPSSSAKCSVSS